VSYEVWTQWVLALVTAFLVGLLAFRSRRREQRQELSWSGKMYAPVINPSLIPNYLLVWWALIPLLMPNGVTWMALSTAQVILESAVYYALLLPAMPFLRRRFSAITCAGLWLLPNAIYVALNARLGPRRTPLTLFVPRSVGRAAAWIWVLGAAAVMLWKISGHFYIRGRLLSGAREADTSAAEALKKECSRTGESKPPRLVVSPAAATPLAIGGFFGRAAIVLPDQGYTLEELSLIFRHELVHIQRMDVWLKLLMVLLTAMCWWNPLMWIAVKYSARDVELGCDESVLLGADDAQRRSYARLLLTQAGDQRGFTTCLSASAEALRYRLRGVMSPGKKRSGALLVAVAVFALVAAYGWIAVAAEAGTAEELFFGGDSAAAARGLWMVTGPEGPMECVDPQALTEYLGDAPLYYLAVSAPVTDGYCFVYETNAGDRGSVFLYLSADGERLYTRFPKAIYATPVKLDTGYVDRLLRCVD